MMNILKNITTHFLTEQGFFWVTVTNFVTIFAFTLNMFNNGVQCYETSVFTVQTKCHEDILENNEVA